MISKAVASMELRYVNFCVIIKTKNKMNISWFSKLRLDDCKNKNLVLLFQKFTNKKYLNFWNQKTSFLIWFLFLMIFSVTFYTSNCWLSNQTNLIYLVTLYAWVSAFGFAASDICGFWCFWCLICGFYFQFVIS